MLWLNAASWHRGIVVGDNKRSARANKAFLGAFESVIETLEARQLLKKARGDTDSVRSRWTTPFPIPRRT
jgi:hypothetical protein